MNKTGLLLVFPLLLAAQPLSAAEVSDKGLARFEHIDTNHDNKIDREEFTKNLPSISPKAFDMINTDKDDHLSVEEWEAFFEGHSKDAAKGAGMPGGMGGMGKGMPGGMKGMGAGMGAGAAGEPATPLITPPAK